MARVYSAHDAFCTCHILNGHENVPHLAFCFRSEARNTIPGFSSSRETIWPLEQNSGTLFRKRSGLIPRANHVSLPTFTQNNALLFTFVPNQDTLSQDNRGLVGRRESTIVAPTSSTATGPDNSLANHELHASALPLLSVIVAQWLLRANLRANMALTL